MLRFVVRRLILLVPILLGLSILVFLWIRALPGSPATTLLGERATAEQIAAINEQYGLNEPIWKQYVQYLGQIARGNLGTTVTDRRPVTDIVRDNGAATLELTFYAMIVALIVGVTFGLLAGRYRDTWIDGTGRLFGIVIYAMPVFFLGLMAQLFFGSYLGWLPTSDRASPIVQATMETHTGLYTVDSIINRDWPAFTDSVKHLVLPAVTLGLVTAGVFIRLIRVNVIRTMKDDYIEAARARGIDERSVVYQHAFRNALVPVITVVGLTVALLLSGAVLTETTFNWPGLGHTLVMYLQNRDYAAVQGLIVVFALIVVVASLVIDFVNAYIDPRIRY